MILFGSLLGDARNFATATYKAKMARLNIEHQKRLNEFRNKVGRVWDSEREYGDYCVDRAQAVIDTIVASYLAAYERFNLPLTEYCITQMRTDFKNVFREELDEMKKISSAALSTLSQRRDYILDQFERAITAAEEELRLQIHETSLPKPEKEPTAPNQYHYNLSVNNNYGGIQQGGQDNTQNFTNPEGNSDEKH